MTTQAATISGSAPEGAAAAPDRITAIAEAAHVVKDFGARQIDDARQVLVRLDRTVRGQVPGYFHANPWKMLAAAAAGGAVLGLLSAGRKQR